jgi:hypothetical protein
VVGQGVGLIRCKYSEHMYVKAKMIPVESISRDKGEQLRV